MTEKVINKTNVPAINTSFQYLFVYLHTKYKDVKATGCDALDAFA